MNAAMQVHSSNSHSADYEDAQDGVSEFEVRRSEENATVIQDAVLVR